MDNKMQLHLTTTINKYRNQILEYGKFDCNLLILEVFEYEKYEKFVGTYDNIKDGVKVAKEMFGEMRLSDYLEKAPEYESIDKKFIKYGDIVVANSARICMIAIGHNKLFAIHPRTNKFEFCDMLVLDTYKVYRRI